MSDGIGEFIYKNLRAQASYRLGQEAEGFDIAGARVGIDQARLDLTRGRDHTPS
jgi:hypothetical protein